MCKIEHQIEHKIENKKSLADHIEDIRYLLFQCIFVFAVSCCIATYYASDIIYQISHNINTEMYVLNILDGLLLRIKVGIITGFIISYPIILYFVYRYIAVILYNSEKIFVLVILLWSLASMYASIFCGVQYLFPYVYDYLSSMEMYNTQLLLTMRSYLNLVFMMSAISCIVLQIPLLVFASARIFGVHNIARYRKFFILFAFIMGAIFTPPDPLSQVMFAICCIILFELSLLFARLLKNDRHKKN